MMLTGVQLLALHAWQCLTTRPGPVATFQHFLFYEVAIRLVSPYKYCKILEILLTRMMSTVV